MICRLVALLALAGSFLSAQERYIPAFPLEPNEIALHRLAQPNTPFNKVGRRFAILGQESGSFEAWAYPLKLFRNFEFSFLIGASTRPIPGREIVKYVNVTPEATTLTYCYQTFTIKAAFITAIDDPLSMILFHVNATEPITIVCGFIPVLQPMWPAGLGGQSAYWNEELKAYQISESTRSHTAYIGSPAASGISYTPAHMLSDAPNEFKIEIPDPLQVRDKYIPIYMTGGKAPRDSVKSWYKRLQKNPQAVYQNSAAHYRSLLSNTLQIHTQHRELDLAFCWSKICLDNMLVHNPDLGQGLIAGLGASGSSGRPGFGWFFGGDAFINSLALNSYAALSTTRNALAFVQKWQRQDGKMAHELSQAAGYIDWFGKYPYGYIHGDTTPFFIVAMYDYYQSTADTLFIKQSWSSLKRALDWCLSMDANQDGLIDNSKAGLGSVEYGALTDLATDIYTGALSVAAFRDMTQLAHLLTDRVYEKKAKTAWAKAENSFDAKFWNTDQQVYANAFGEDNEQIQEVSPWIAMPSVLRVGDSLHNYLSLKRLCRSDMTTDWGIRSISEQSKYFGSLNYNYGAVWPFLSGYVALAQFNAGLIQQGFFNLKNISNLTFDNNLGCISEVYSGSLHTWPAESVSQQGFSSMAVALALVRGWLGFSVNVPMRTISYQPHIMAGYEELELVHPFLHIAQKVTNKSDGWHALSLSFTSVTDYPLTVQFAPHLPITTDSVWVEREGQPVPAPLRGHVQSVHTTLKFQLDHIVTITVNYRAGVTLPSFLHTGKIGEPSTGLKVIDMVRDQSGIVIHAQGMSGKAYHFPAAEMTDLAEVEHAVVRKVEGVSLVVDDEQPGRFVGIKMRFTKNVQRDFRRQYRP